MPIVILSVMDGSDSTSWKVLPGTMVSNASWMELVSTFESHTARRYESVATSLIVLSSTVRSTPERMGRDVSFEVTL